jgi:hypothetical protein
VLKMMFVLTIIVLQPNTTPTVVSHHSTLEACEKAFQSLKSQLAKNTDAPTFKTTPLRTYACTETEVWPPSR